METRRQKPTCLWTPFFVFATLFATGCGGEAPADPPETNEPPRKPAFFLMRSGLTVDGRRVTLPGGVAAWEEVLGKPSRREQFAAEGKQAAIIVHVWDAHGITAYERPDIGAISKVALTLDASRVTAALPDEKNLRPSQVFPGSLSIEGVPVHPNSTPEGINRHLANEAFQRNAKFPFSWNMSYGLWTITAITNAKGDGLSELLIGE